MAAKRPGTNLATAALEDWDMVLDEVVAEAEPESESLELAEDMEPMPEEEAVAEAMEVPLDMEPVAVMLMVEEEAEEPYLKGNPRSVLGTQASVF